MMIKHGTGEVVRDEHSQEEMTQNLAAAAAKHRDEEDVREQGDDDNQPDE